MKYDEEFWANAPEGYPVWVESLINGVISDWYKDGGDRWIDRGGRFWTKAAEGRGSCKAHFMPWNGEGMPHVGAVCEMSHEHWGNRGWEEVTLKYISAEYAITTNSQGEQHWYIRNVSFRPLKTPEQKAAEEREAAIADYMDDLCISEKLASIMYDRGYRKQ